MATIGLITICIILIIITSNFSKIISLRKIHKEFSLGRTDTLFRFDPNTVTYEELRLLGFNKRTAAGIIKYRAAGKVFGIPEEFATCYGVHDSMYVRVRPYIHIGSEFATKPEVKVDSTSRNIAHDRFSPRPFERFSIDTVGVEYLRLIGFSTRQAENLIRYRERGGGIYSMNELRDCYAVSEEMADSLEHFVILSVRDPYEGLVEINSADSASLRKVRGVGSKTVVAIMQYRKLLGGFVRKEQLSELKCVTNENFELICKQIYCDSCKISKIDINFAPASDFEHHPYMTRRAVKSILEQRELKGGWSSIEEMIEDNIFVKEQAIALAPYLLFGNTPQDFD